jgi:hypothetical protein
MLEFSKKTFADLADSIFNATHLDKANISQLLPNKVGREAK